MRTHTFPRVFYLGKIGFSLPRVFRRVFLGVFLRGHHRHAIKTQENATHGFPRGFPRGFPQGGPSNCLTQGFPRGFPRGFPQAPPHFSPGGKVGFSSGGKPRGKLFLCTISPGFSPGGNVGVSSGVGVWIPLHFHF